jgi:hypothetical protein
MINPLWNRQQAIERWPISEEMKNRAYQRSVALIPDFGTYRASNFLWNIEPPDDGICRLCYEWRRYPVGQRHFGFSWWRTCKLDHCSCEHHKTVVWMATLYA